MARYRARKDDDGNILDYVLKDDDGNITDRILPDEARFDDGQVVGRKIPVSQQFLDAYKDNPTVQAIAAERQRIWGDSPEKALELAATQQATYEKNLARAQGQRGTPYSKWITAPEVYADEGELGSRDFWQQYVKNPAAWDGRTSNPNVVPFEEWIKSDPLITNTPEYDWATAQGYDVTRDRGDIWETLLPAAAMMAVPVAGAIGFGQTGAFAGMGTFGGGGLVGGASGAGAVGAGGGAELALGGSAAGAGASPFVGGAAGAGAAGVGAGLAGGATGGEVIGGLGGFVSDAPWYQPFLDALPSGASSFLDMFAPSGGGNFNDLLGGLLQGGLGYLGADKQADAFRDVYNQQSAIGAPYRDRLNASYSPGFDLMSQPGYGDAFNRMAEISTNSWSPRGNPANNPGIQAGVLNDVWAQNYLPALSNYRGQLGQFGGMGLNTAANASLMGAQTADNGIAALAGGAGRIFGEATQPSFDDILKKLGGNLTLNVGGSRY